MRPRLTDTSREKPARPERRRSERRSRRRGAERLRRAGEEHEAPQAVRAPELELPAQPPAANQCCDPCDPDVEKVRRAGGPLDEAVYTCSCGYLFSAAVSTTVSCPHCGCGQAW